MIVMKFGGTSAAERPRGSVGAGRQVAVQPEGRDWRGPVVVVSALSGATDRLLGIAAQAGAGDIDGAQDHLRALCARHLDVAGIVIQPEERQQVDRFIRDAFDELERIVGALGVLREVTPRWLDAIAATGEIASSRIVAAALTSHGLASAWVDARQVMVTSDTHVAAAPLVAETTTAVNRIVNPLLASRRIPV